MSEAVFHPESVDIHCFPPERIVLGDNADGSLQVGLTQAGLDALAASDCPDECDFCRTLFANGDEYYRVTLGMDDTPNHAGAKPAQDCTVESTSELVICSRCEPQMTAAFDAFLEQLWALRAPDPTPAPSEEAT